MQTFFNPTTPFFDAEGHPMVGARVSFLDLSTSASLIELTDNEGTPLPNPLFTGSDGRLRLENGNGAPAVPCIADGLSYKVVVARKTGVEPIFMGGILQNPEELYENPFIAFVVTAMGGSGAGSNTSVIGSVADVRLADKTLGSVVCSGYYEAGDCPARVFTWVESQEPPQDNGINILRNPEDNTGYWRMSDPHAGTWDVRMAGLTLSDTDAAQNSVRLQALLNAVGELLDVETAATRIYFPKGVWHLSAGFTAYSKVVFGYGSLLRFKGVSDKALNFYGGIESYGSGNVSSCYIFDTPDGTGLQDRLNIVCGQGTFRTSWIGDSKVSTLSVRDTLVIDLGRSENSSSGAQCVIVEADITGRVDFRNCSIVCDGKIDDSGVTGALNIFQNCTFTDLYFKNASFDAAKLSLVGCTVDIDDFSSVLNWANARLKNGDRELDFQGHGCDSFTISANNSSYSYRVLNGTFGSLSFMAPNSTTEQTRNNVLELVNCKVGALNGDFLWKDLSMDCCEVTAGMSRTYIADYVGYAEYGLVVAGNVVARNSILVGSSTGNLAVGVQATSYDPVTSSYLVGKVELRDCVVSGHVHGTEVVAYGCSFTSTVKQWSTDASKCIIVDGCTFSASGNVATLGKNAYIVDNRFYQGGNPEDAVSAPNVLTSWTYEGNVGNCLKNRLSVDMSAVVGAQKQTVTGLGDALLLYLYPNASANLHLWGPSGSRNVRVRFLVTNKVFASGASFAINGYHTFVIEVVYANVRPDSFSLPTITQVATDFIEDGSRNVVAIDLPDGVSVDSSSIERIIAEAEVI